MATDNITSDFLDDINNQIGDVNSVTTEFSDIKECYISKFGYTRLFKAKRFGKTYMLKCLKKDYLYTPLYRMALNKEFEIGLQLEHPNICHTIGWEELDGLGPTIILEYIDGETLESLIDRGMLTKTLSRKYVRQLIDVLGYMHHKQIIHRDLKPSNIMVTHKGMDIKLIDFSLSDSDTFNVLKAPGGTSGYIAPELFMPEAKSDIRCDIYSFGVLMSNMAEATDDKALMQTACKCMDHNPTQRPQCMEDITIQDGATPWQIIAAVILTITAICQLIYIVTIATNSQ